MNIGRIDYATPPLDTFDLLLARWEATTPDEGTGSGPHQTWLPVHAGEFFCNSRRMSERADDELKLLLARAFAGHGNAITGRVGLAQFLPASRDPRFQNI
jgi:hypothetical protein